MKRRTKIWYKPLSLVMLGGALALTGCSGDDGAPGRPGMDVPPGTVNNLQAQIDALVADVKPESCSVCHDGNVVRSGQTHQDAYNELFQLGVVVIDPATVTYTNDGVSDIVEFQMTKNGLPFDCTQADSLSINFTEYTGAAYPGTPFTSLDFTVPADGTIDSLSIGTLSTTASNTISFAGGVCTSTKDQSARGDLNAIPGVIVIYGRDETVTSDPVAHLNLARFPFATVLATGPAGVDYVSAANVAGCEKCHTVPYFKHGFIQGAFDADGDGTLDAATDFYTCKACHIDNDEGSHTEWQHMVDDPQGWATGAALTPTQQARYAYTRRLMNDVHMSHSMEFPYPQSMANCNTCHEGKLPQTLSDANFVLETCKSCHPITGGTDLPNAANELAIDTRPHALSTILSNAAFNHATVLANIDAVPAPACNGCHTTGGIAPVFSAIHNGFNPVIYAYDSATQTAAKYADGINVTIDTVTLAGTDLTIAFSATGTVGGLNATAITPLVMVSFYGYDSKDFILSSHTRDANSLRMEFTIGSADNALFTTVDGDGTTDGTWSVTLHMAGYVPVDPTIQPSIPDMIGLGVIKRAEIAVLPTLRNAANQTVGLNAPSRTFDLTTGAFVDNYFSGTNAIVSVEGTADTKGCNSCHDQLATTFHSGNRGGNIVVCRMCHVVTSGGSHLEGQSRSIDSYAHAVHRFQAFDVDEVDFTDPVEAAHYQEHINFLFPDFATINCMACHTQSRAVDSGNRAAFDVPDQSKSMPGLLSATDEIPGVIPVTTPEVVTGPAARACGACHRASFINNNDAGGFASFNQHTKDFGYRVENDANDAVLFGVIDKIMSMFE